MAESLHNNDLFHLVLQKLETGILIFEGDQLKEMNEAAKTLLRVESSNQPFGPYEESLRGLLLLSESHYSKQLTGVLGKPLNATLHSLGQWKIIELKESFETRLGEASHELRRPLTNVKTLVDTLHLWGAAEDPVARPKFMAQLHGEVQRLTKLVEELLNLSRLQAGSIPLHFQQIALGALVEETFDLLREQAEKSEVELINEVDESFVLIADIDKLTHVVQNLIENGIRYNKKGGKVVVKCGTQANSFSVSDTGSGIAKENLTQIFERFKRFNKEIPGTGLGLAIVKSIVDLHGGTINVSSEPGKGSEFTVSIPPKKLTLPVNT